jgi:hypothetical protein|tara:strand:+ start:186 stop:329 length:144 start_codon:yes stop_codon:yes gene_type:complete
MNTMTRYCARRMDASEKYYYPRRKPMSLIENASSRLSTITFCILKEQ